MSQTLNKRRVFVVGVGLTKFEKPGARNWDYPDMVKEAGTKALVDAGISYTDVEQAVVGYVYGDSTCGQRALYTLGNTGIPIYNVNNNCSTGSTALMLGKQLIEGGLADCVLAVGFEKMERGSLTIKFTDRTQPLDRHMQTMQDVRPDSLTGKNIPFAPRMFGSAAREHSERFGTTPEQYANVALKNHRHSVHNPYSQFRTEYSLKEVLNSPMIFAPLTKLQCCPTSDGAACIVLASESFVLRHALESQAVEILAMSLATDLPSSFRDSCINMVGFDMSKKAAQEVYKRTGLTSNDAQVVELHDCFSCNELITYEALGLCEVGKGGQLVDSGNVTYGGKWVVNPSGGLISKGHPLGATGLAQCAELTWQLRGMAGPRQVKNCRVALQHNIGLGGAAVVAMYRLGFPDKFQPYPPGKPNPALDPNANYIQAANPTSITSSTISLSPSDFKASSVFSDLKETIAANPSLVKSIGGTYQFNITNAAGKTQSWTVDLKNGTGSVGFGSQGNAECILEVADEDFVGMMTGKLKSQELFMKGKLKIKGNMGLAMKLGKLQEPKAKL